METERAERAERAGSKEAERAERACSKEIGTAERAERAGSKEAESAEQVGSKGTETAERAGQQREGCHRARPAAGEGLVTGILVTPEFMYDLSDHRLTPAWIVIPLAMVLTSALAMIIGTMTMRLATVVVTGIARGQRVGVRILTGKELTAVTIARFSIKTLSGARRAAVAVCPNAVATVVGVMGTVGTMELRWGWTRGEIE
jgi:hypothetical protein